MKIFSKENYRKVTFKEVYSLFYFLALVARDKDLSGIFMFLRWDIVDKVFIVGAAILLLLVSQTRPSFNRVFKSFELVLIVIFLLNYNLADYLLGLLFVSGMVLIAKGFGVDSESKGTS